MRQILAFFSILILLNTSVYCQLVKLQKISFHIRALNFDSTSSSGRDIVDSSICVFSINDNWLTQLKPHPICKKIYEVPTSDKSFHFVIIIPNIAKSYFIDIPDSVKTENNRYFEIMIFIKSILNNHYVVESMHGHTIVVPYPTVKEDDEVIIKEYPVYYLNSKITTGFDIFDDCYFKLN